MKVYLGIDVGTSKICVLALDGISGRPIDIVSEKNSSGVKCEKGFSEQDPKIIREKTIYLVNKIRRRIKSEISGVGITGQMHGMLLVDKSLKPLTNLITWQDKRSEKLIPEILSKAGDNPFCECGCLIRPGYMGASLFWFYKNKLIPKNVYKACFIHDWIGANLANQNFMFTDPTNAASSGLFNVKKMDWNRELIGKLGIKEKIFPEIRSSGETIGFTKEGVPVGCALGDNQASILGSFHGYRDGECINMNIGTGSQVSVIVRNFTKISDGLELRPYLNGKYILVGASLSGGAAYSVLRDFFESVGMKLCGVRGDSIFQKMNRLASKAPEGCDGLVCSPYFFGERGREELKASFNGLDANNFTVSHVSRAMLEGMVRVLHEFYGRMRKKRKYIVGSGNGIKRNRVLQKVTEKTFNMDLKLSPYEEEAAYGTALLAAKSGGEYA